MTIFDENGNPVDDQSGRVRPDWAPGTALDGSLAWCHVMYGLHALSALSGILTSATIIGSFIFGWPSIIAVIISYVTRSQVNGTWLESHWRWQLRTFWFGVLWLVVAGLLTITFIGIPAAWMVIIVTGLWVLYRVTRGWLGLLKRALMPVPPG